MLRHARHAERGAQVSWKDFVLSRDKGIDTEHHFARCSNGAALIASVSMLAINFGIDNLLLRQRLRYGAIPILCARKAALHI